MKNLIFILLAVSSMVSCRLDKPDPLPEKYTVQLLLDREDIVERDEPLTLTKASSKDLYAVQIYKKGSINYSRYAYGIFDDESRMSLELELGSTYKIEVSVVPNGKGLIAKGENGGYQNPFLVGGFSGTPGKITNEFILATTNYIDEINVGKAVVNEEGGKKTEYARPPIERYYGVVKNYRPERGGTLTIPLKYVCFGLTIVPEDFTEGSIEVKMEGAPTFTLTPDDPTAVTKKIFTFDNFMGNDWTADDYSEDIPIAITWTKGDGSKIQFSKSMTSYTITRKMNKILTLLCSNAGQGSLVLERENDTLVDDPETLEQPTKN